ncbi:hypothetical protein KKG36_00565 [Patescibacteria group bacterium]|nr:hypothetical protein [Patescibacteria group bacterium]
MLKNFPKPLTAALCFLIGLCLLFLGVFSGIYAGKEVNRVQVEKSEALIKALRSNLLPNLSAFGQIKEVVNRKIVLNYAGDTMEIIATNDASVSILSTASDQMPRSIQFTSLRAGDYVTLSLVIEENGDIFADKITVMPFIKNQNI